MITFEHSRDLVLIERRGYSMLDWASDIGGMSGAMLRTFGFMISIWNYGTMKKYLV